MQIKSNDQAALYLLFTFQVIGLLYGLSNLLLTMCNQNRRLHQTKKGLVLKLTLIGLLVRWTVLTVSVIKEDQSLSSEWNPYALLHIPDDGSFDTKEIREAYRKLSKKYHPDKVNWEKLKGQEEQVNRRY